MSAPTAPRIVRCPACGEASEYSAANPWRPFCCERCKNHDFGAWASERFRVADPAAPEFDEGGGETPSRH